MRQYLQCFKRERLERKILSIFLAFFLIFPLFIPIANGFSFFGWGKTIETPTRIKNKIPEITIENWVAVLVEDGLYQNIDLKEKIDRYALDAAKEIEGRSIIIPIPTDVSPKDIYEGLAELYFMGPNGDGKSQLKGIVLIGNIPLPVVEKNGSLWPTIFPYVDFENPVYYWDNKKNRFVFDQTQSMEADIWHGVIRSQQDDADQRQKEISDFLDQNHLVHTGETTFPNKVLVVDTKTQNQISPVLEARYNQWLKHIEDITYKRYVKALLADVETEVNIANKDLVSHELPKAEFEKIVTTLSDQLRINRNKAVKLINETEKTIPDIKIEELINLLSADFSRVNEAWDNLLSDQLDSTGAWTYKETDSTIELVTRRDKISALDMKMTNDLFEDSFEALLRKNNVGEHISIRESERLRSPTDKYGLTEDKEVKPLYWNGIARNNLKVKDCSLFRGIVADENHPYAQKVQANRTLNPDTIDTCDLTGTISNNSEKAKYAGCCINNLYKKGVETLDYCDAGSTWKFDLGTNGWGHQGAELPIFDITGTRAEDGPDGAKGCEEILALDNEDPAISTRFDTLELHVEPTFDTLKAQRKAGFSRALPVDDPRGFSFYDHGRSFQRLDFINVFDLRGKVRSESQLKETLQKLLQDKISEINKITKTGNTRSSDRYEIDKLSIWPIKEFKLPPSFDLKRSCQYGRKFGKQDPFTRSITWTEDCTFTSRAEVGEDNAIEPITTHNKVVRYYEEGRLISLDLVASILSQIDIGKLYESFVWIDQDINTKNQEILKLSFGNPKKAQDTLLDPTINGYQLVHLSTENTDGSTLDIGFKPIDQNFDVEFAEAKSNSIGFVPKTDKYEPKFLGRNLSETLKNGSTLVIENQEPRLVEAKNINTARSLTTSPKSIVVSNKGYTPIPIIFSLRNKKGQIESDNYQSEVAIEFSSGDVDKFFEIFPPEKKVKLDGGKATFFLKPKENIPKLGAKFSLSAVITEEGKRIRSTAIPVTVTRYKSRLTTSADSVAIGDKKGVLLSMNIFDESGVDALSLDGKILNFKTNTGSFAGGVSTAQISEGKASIRFFPGKVSGKNTITVQSKDSRIPTQEISINILPSKPYNIKLITESDTFIKGKKFYPITVKIFDRFGNVIKDENHELSWQISGAEVKDRAERDTDPRKNGIQEWVTKSESTLYIRPTEKTIEISVTSSLLDKTKKASRRFLVADQATLAVTATEDVLTAGKGVRPIKVFVQAVTATGNPIANDIKVQTSVSPVDFLHFPKELQLKKGRGVFELYPGTKSGDYIINFFADGMEPVPLEIEIRPAKPVKIKLNTTSLVWDKDAKEIPLDVIVTDAYENKILEDIEVSLRVTTPSQGLLKINTTDIKLKKGKSSITVEPLGKLGNVNIIAEANEVLSDTLSLRLTDLIEAKNISKEFEAKSILTLLTGSTAGNLLKEKNTATGLLFSGNTQAVVTMSAPNELAKKSYGFIGADGKVAENLKVKFYLNQSHLKVILMENERVLAQVKAIFFAPPSIYLDPSENQKGINISLNKNVRDIKNRIRIEKRTIIYDNEPLLHFSENGGVSILSAGISLKLNEQNILKWKFLKDGVVLGEFDYKLDKVLTTNNDYIENEFEGLLLNVLAPNIKTGSIFTGNGTNGTVGYALLDTEKKASPKQRLGSTQASIERTEISASEAWNGQWNPVNYFSSGNIIGDSITAGMSDAVILLGDPTLSRPDGEEKTAIGKSIWETEHGPIEDLLAADINGDGNLDILARVGNRLFGLYNSGKVGGDFVEEGPILAFEDGIESLISLSTKINGDTKGRPTNLVQINSVGDFILYKNTDGVFDPQKVPFAQKFIEVKAANLNGDRYTDIVALDKNQVLWTILQNKDGFAKPKFIEDLSPRFDDVLESNEDKKASDYLNSVTIEAEKLDTTKTQLSLEEANVIAQIELKSEEAKVRIGTTIKTKLTVDAGEDLGQARLTIPSYNNFNIVLDTVRCQSCNEKIETKRDVQSGETFVYIPNLLANRAIVLEWDMKVVSLPETVFFVGDFESGKDGLDDIVVPWDFGGEIKLLEFLSSEQELASKNKWLVSLDNFWNRGQWANIKNISSKLLAQVITNTPTTSATTKNNTEKSIEKIRTLEDIKQAIEEKYFQTPKDLEKPESVVCDTVNPSVASNAPGLVFKYDSALSAYAKPVSLIHGVPEFQAPTTIWTPGATPSYNTAGVPNIDPPITVKGGQFPSTLRFYKIPTSTGQTVSAICRGLYAEHMFPNVWNQNCYVLGVARSNEVQKNCIEPNNTNNLIGQAQNITVGSDGTDIVIVDETKQHTPGKLPLQLSKVLNRQIPAVDSFTQWMLDQSRYFSQNFTRILPDLTWFKPESRVQKETNVKAITRNDATASTALEKQLNESLPITITRNSIPISIPNPALFEGKNLTPEQEEYKRSYDIQIKRVYKQEAKNLEIIKKAKTVAQELSQYEKSWVKVNEKRLDDWDQSGKNLQQLYDLVRLVSADYLADFTRLYRTNVVDRGTWLPWLYETLSGKVDDKILTFKTPPDINIDTSNIVPGGIVVTLTEFLPTWVGLSPDRLKPYREGDYPESTMVVTVPSLPVIPEPPELPLKIFDDMMQRMETPRDFSGLFGQLRQGVASVPEWGLKPYVEQLTNRKRIFNYDRKTMDFRPRDKWKPTKKKQKDIPQEILKKSSQAYFIDNLQSKALAFTPKNKTQEKFKDLILAFKPEYNQDKKDRSEIIKLRWAKSIAKLENLQQKSIQHLAKIKNKKSEDKYFTANNIPKLVIPKVINLPDHDSNIAIKLPISEKEEPPADNGLYQMNAETGDLTKILTQGLLPNSKVLLWDLDEDGNDEIFYTNGGRLYLKGIESTKKREVESTDLVYWDFDKFKSKRDVARNIIPTPTGISFEPINPEIGYYEWFVSDRPDAVFEMTKSPSDRKSKRWERNAFIRKILLEDYRITDVPARITQVIGESKIKTLKLEKLPSYSYEKCKNPEVKKPFLDTRSVLTATEDQTKIEIRVPARQFKPAEYQSITLNNGETTSISYGEVCVFDGAVKMVRLNDTDTIFTPKIGDILVSEMETQLTAGTSLQLQLSDGSLIQIYGEDHYQLHYFDPTENPIGYGGLAPHTENLYGFLMGVENKKRTLVRRNFLHAGIRD